MSGHKYDTRLIFCTDIWHTCILQKNITIKFAINSYFLQKKVTNSSVYRYLVIRVLYTVFLSIHLFFFLNVVFFSKITLNTRLIIKLCILYTRYFLKKKDLHWLFKLLEKQKYWTNAIHYIYQNNTPELLSIYNDVRIKVNITVNCSRVICNINWSFIASIFLVF